MRVSAEEKRNLLIQRGFSPDEIEGGFTEYINGSKKWYINTVTPIEVSETYDLEVIAKLFLKNSVNEQGFACIGEFRTFNDYSSIHESRREDLPNASAFDPFVARLVFAVNHCCISTAMSCDGWHEEDYRQGEIVLWMKSRYDTVWFWIIAERVFGETGPRKWPYYKYLECWVDSFEPDNEIHRGIDGTKVIYRIKENDEANAYKKINQYACFLEETSDELCAIREKWITSLQSEIDKRNNFRIGFVALKRRILESVEEDLQPLRDKWNIMRRELDEMTGKGVQAWDLCYY